MSLGDMRRRGAGGRVRRGAVDVFQITSGMKSFRALVPVLRSNVFQIEMECSDRLLMVTVALAI